MSWNKNWDDCHRAILDFFRVERKKKKHSEYWAGRLKGKKETMEKELAMGVWSLTVIIEYYQIQNSIDEDLDDPTRMLFYPKPDSYEDDVSQYCITHHSFYRHVGS